MIPHARASTPSRPSPITRLSAPRSPTKSSVKSELSLSLSHIIGSTCSSSLRFSLDAASSSFAYAAGAAVVLATVDPDLHVEQRFFRAAAQAVARPMAPGGGIVGTPIREEMRRLGGGGRGREGSPFGAPVEMEGSPVTGHAKDRVKAATAVALARGGKWLAVGETGYRPRVLVFAVTEKKSTEQPVAILGEHSFGVQAVAWEGEGTLLATLGTVNDGFLFVWGMDEAGRATLVASNKCTNIVRDMKWMGRCLVTVGTRFVKVWRPDEVAPSMGVDGEKEGLSHPGYKPLVGRNTLLADMLEATFTVVVPLSDTRAVICSDAGDICILDDTDKQQRLTRIAVENFAITSACLAEDGQVVVTGSSGEIKAVGLSISKRSDTPVTRSGTPSSRRGEQRGQVYPVAIGQLPYTLVTVDNQHAAHFHTTKAVSADASSFSRVSSLASHSDAILGVRIIRDSKDGGPVFATWSSGGSIIGWTNDGMPSFQLSVPLDQVDDAYELTNELRTLAFFPGNLVVATGDRYGILRVVDIEGGSTKFAARAHSSEITGISVTQSRQRLYVATASRDRTIQVFIWKDNNLDLVQTLDEHAGAVTQVAFSEDGKRLLSCSADRTMVIREGVEDEEEGATLFAIARTVTLKAAPIALDFAANTDQVVVSTADRLVCLINYQNGRILSTFKTGDNEGGDPVALSSIVHMNSGTGPGVVAGVASADKSIRMYSEEGVLLARDWGHTEGVTDIALLTRSDGSDGGDVGQRLVTVAADGTIFVWSSQTRKPAINGVVKMEDVLGAGPSSSPLARPPLRKVISHSEMSRLRRSMVSPSDDESTVPTALKSPPPGALRKRPSRLSVGQAPKLNPTSPRYSTPRESSRSPTLRDRSPSPARSLHSPSRSPVKSPDKTPRRRISQVNMRKQEVPHIGPAAQSLSRGVDSTGTISEPAKTPEVNGLEDSAEGRTERAEALIGALRRYRSELCSSPPRKLSSQVDSTLRGELESLLRAMSLQEMAPVERSMEPKKTARDVTRGSEGAADVPEVLESVEERSEII
ncbi:Mitogen-activated protein kinase-binding protein 1 [Sphaceloma murrayae]|uniref:Mitogen-activated protein kinase-binding protein 1 n=1 Tax=Sphaceloma murrayae TaxID=2082308 RepID=A0A2K1QP99_9PEZI|nr:Mitogen-activated protein kinase-binding protein 1 [Sphaceloma murrayae]